MDLEINHNILNLLHIDKLLKIKDQDGVRLFVNMASAYFLEDKEILDFKPSAHNDYIDDYFTDVMYPEDWYELVSGDFLDAVELNVDSVLSSLPLVMVEFNSDNDVVNHVIDIARKWQNNARSNLVSAIDAYI